MGTVDRRPHGIFVVDGGRKVRARPTRSLRRGFGLLLALYFILTSVQYTLLEYHAQQKSNASLSRLLDDILAKYNLTLPEQSAKIRIPDANRSIALLHVGKTGGSTISKHIRNGCAEWYFAPCKNRKGGWIANETVASHRIERYYHLEDIPSEQLQQLTTIIVTVRNPIKRFLSAFAYHHPSNAQARGVGIGPVEEWQKYTCFPSISHLVKAAVGRAEIQWNKAYSHSLIAGGRRTLNSGTKEILQYNCSEIALLPFGLNKTWSTIQTKHASWQDVNTTHPWVNTMSFGYRQNYQSLPPGKEIIVLRNEHLWDDWATVNHLLAKENDTYRNWPEVLPFQNIERNDSAKYPVKRRWRLKARQEELWLCQLLHEEIRTYLMILMRAINLDEQDVWEAVSDVEKTCGLRSADTERGEPKR